MNVRAKKNIVARLRHKYRLKDLCDYLGIRRSTLRYEYKPKKADVLIESAVIEMFYKNREAYGCNKISKSMKKKGYCISKKRVKGIMKKFGLVAKWESYRKINGGRKVNEEAADNIIGREFGQRRSMEVVVSDLTYVMVGGRWMYICLLIELAHREIIGYAAGAAKDASLVKAAFGSVRYDLREVKIFHTDRGSEFKNETLDRMLSAFGIKRSLSRKGTPIDNAVAESMYDILKVEFVYREAFNDIKELRQKLSEYVWWYNNNRIHSALGYISPVEAKRIGISAAKSKHYEFDEALKKFIETAA